jgi:hypothetical protein
LLSFGVPNIANPPITIGDRVVTDGTFKVPSLRNLELTAPYFHNGGQRTIRQVVEFYNRGGDFREHNVQNIDFEIGKLNLTNQQIDDLVAFLSRPLTDPRRAEWRRHERTPPARDRGRCVAHDIFLEIPAVGQNGGPLATGFLQ